MPDAPHHDRPQERVDEIVERLPEFGVPKPATFLEATGARQMAALLAVICIVTGLFLVAWWTTRPGLKDVEALLKSTAGTPAPVIEADKLVETLGKLQRDHTEQFRSLFQLVVMSALLPLFTLLAGYVFGKTQATPARAENGERKT